MGFAPKILVAGPWRRLRIFFRSGKLGAANAAIKRPIQVRNGDMLRIAPGDPGIIDKLPLRAHLQRTAASSAAKKAIGVRDRRKLAFAGHVARQMSCWMIATSWMVNPDLVAIGLAEVGPTRQETSRIAARCGNRRD